MLESLFEQPYRHVARSVPCLKIKTLAGNNSAHCLWCQKGSGPGTRFFRFLVAFRHRQLALL